MQSIPSSKAGSPDAFRKMRSIFTTDRNLGNGEFPRFFLTLFAAGVFLKRTFLIKKNTRCSFLDFFVNKEYKVFFFPAILELENSPSILKSRQMSKKEYFIFFLREKLKKENTWPVL